jgi:hypothetical protein
VDVSKVSSVSCFVRLTACDSGQYMGNSIEEKELGRHRSLDQHNDAGSDDSQEADDVHHADGIEDDITWSGQRLG